MCSSDLSKLRQEKSRSLVNAIVAALKDLNFLDVKFEMHFDRLADYTSN